MFRFESTSVLQAMYITIVVFTLYNRLKQVFNYLGKTNP